MYIKLFSCIVFATVSFLLLLAVKNCKGLSILVSAFLFPLAQALDSDLTFGSLALVVACWKRREVGRCPDEHTTLPQWSGVDNPDGLTTGVLSKTNTCLCVSAVASS